MRSWKLAILLAVGLTCSPASVSAADKVLPVAEAKAHLNEKAVVELVVKSSRLLDTGKYCFLNSEKDFHQKTNFTVTITAAALEKFSEAGIDDPAEHFHGQTIHVAGKITLYKNQPQIQIDDPQQITIIKTIEAKLPK